MMAQRYEECVCALVGGLHWKEPGLVEPEGCGGWEAPATGGGMGGWRG